VLGFSVGQLGYGRLSDRFGRKPELLAGMAIFIAGSLVASLSTSFEVLLVARAIQGFGAAAPRVIAIAIVRDLYAGRQMARIMSFIMSVFIIIPVLAPSIGQELLNVGTWRLNFDLMLVAGIIVAAWTWLRLPETNADCLAETRLPLSTSLKLALETPQTIGYAVSAGFLFGCLMSYVSSAQQVFTDVFDLGTNFPIAFGAIASLMALASVVNASLVEWLGMRRVSHTSLTLFIAAAAVLAGLAANGAASLMLFIALMAALFFLFGLIAPNFNALAMEPQGHNAGMASSMIGFVSTGVGALGGGTVGHMFDGSVLPLALGFLALSVMAALIVMWVEGLRGLYGVGR
jgi:DHA1 family bicyclomycin/chloramphenicol resistance-like MFS transporter